MENTDRRSSRRASTAGAEIGDTLAALVKGGNQGRATMAVGEAAGHCQQAKPGQGGQGGHGGHEGYHYHAGGLSYLDVF